jgi:phosphoenolpyruvate carboxykinase (ATP)
MRWSRAKRGEAASWGNRATVFWRIELTETGIRNPGLGAEAFGFDGLAGLYWNDSAATLVERSVRRCEGSLTADGALAVKTGMHTGRSAQDKFVVRTPTNENAIWWDNNKPMDPETFAVLKADMIAHAQRKHLFAQDLHGGADPSNRINVRVFAEYAWHALFIRHLLIRPQAEELESFVPGLTIVDLPSFRADPERHGCRSETVIACDLENGIVLIGGTSYAGEMKKSVFTALNYSLPDKGVMPMHCSANVTESGDVAVFFGLSGTGKTTLSADPARSLIGDDEHGWSADGVFNFEGGCYAKTIRLSRDAEPQIFAATERFGTVLENVVLNDQTRQPEFDDGALTENTRAAYPISAIANASDAGRAGHPRSIVMLTCDAFGVMPPIARMSASQAVYHFLSGYTAKVAGTEKGVTEPQATFSTCFGAPFMPRHPSEYGNLLRELIEQHDAQCWLVNTGWTGGSYGTGTRMPIKATRVLLTAALDGALDGVEMRTDPVFGFDVPTSVPGLEAAGIDPTILDPRSTWADHTAYDRQASELARMFNENFNHFVAHVDAPVLEAAPGLADAAE